MKLDFFQNQTLDAIESYMGRLSQRQQIVNSNLANIDTPGYRTKDVSFHATMEELMAENSAGLNASRPEHIGQRTPVARRAEVFEVQGLRLREDIDNNVSLDEEMLKLSETAFGYALMSQIVRGKLRMIATSINEGRA